MALKAVYLPNPRFLDTVVEIADEEHRHLMVARAEPGERIEVFDGLGKVWTCELISVGKRSSSARLQDERSVLAPGVELTLGLALIRTSAFELALEKAVEVGVARIIPFTASRSNVSAPSRRERWQRILIEAAKQSKRFFLPVIDLPIKFARILEVTAASRLLLAEHGGAALKACLNGSPVLYLVGPEGGWTEDELQSARVAGFREVSLGSGILRSETAAIVGAALIRYELGDM